MYNVSNEITADEFKEFRKKYKMTQKEFAAFIGVSTSTVERLEKCKEKIIGPEAMLVNILSDNEEWLETRKIPDKKKMLRIWFMYKDKCNAIIDVDDARQEVSVTNFEKNIYFLPFGANKNPNYEEYLEFLKSRCFPETRDKMKIQLEALGIPFYDPLIIIEKTEGRMADDDFWIKLER